MAPIDVVQAQAEAATRRQALAQAEASAQTAELALKRLIVDGPQDPLWRSHLEPTDRPAFVPISVDPDAAVSRALSTRTDLTAARKQLQANEVTIAYLRNLALPALDLVGGYGLQGLGGTQFLRQGTGIGGTIVGTVPGGFGDALSNLRNADYPSWNVGVSISYPIAGSQADADVARARILRTQTRAQIKALELEVATEVSGAGLQVRSNIKRVEASTAARGLAEKRLDAEQSKFEVGLSTNFFVVQAQRDLADVQNAELRALLDYQKSLVEFERSQESSLSGAGIVVITTGTGTGTAQTTTAR
jgi:outer membrane protein TolC